MPSSTRICPCTWPPWKHRNALYRDLALRVRVNTARLLVIHALVARRTIWNNMDWLSVSPLHAFLYFLRPRVGTLLPLMLDWTNQILEDGKGLRELLRLDRYAAAAVAGRRTSCVYRDLGCSQWVGAEGGHSARTSEPPMCRVSSLSSGCHAPTKYTQLLTRLFTRWLECSSLAKDARATNFLGTYCFMAKEALGLPTIK